MIKFSIISIKELEFSCKSPLEVNSDFQTDKSQLEATLNVNYRWNMDKNLFGVVIEIIYSSKDSNKDSIGSLKFSYITEFFIENLKEVFKVKAKNDFEIDENFEANLVGIAISSGRGVLFEKTKGTFFNNFIFPIVNPKELILSKRLKKKAV